MLRVDDCVLTYPDFRARYSLTVDHGALCAVVGPSGGGKTTLLHLIAGFEQPDSGRITFDHANLTDLPPARRPVAIVFQDHNLFPHLSAHDNVALGVKPSLALDQSERAVVQDALEAVELSAFASRRPSDMSGGQRQRVALARAIAGSKPLLLLDEPLSGLDPGLRRSMVATIDHLRRSRGITVLMTIHTPEDIGAAADSMVFVAEGEAIAFGRPADVLNPKRDPRISAFLG
jgi:thiamine transport system ATP-binding protein